MKDLDWQALNLFIVVAEAGSLAAAAETSGISAPTLGRHMTALEKSLGRKLFIRHQTGYELAVDGKSLAEQVRVMRNSANNIRAWSDGAYQLPYVTVSAGTWTSRFLIQNLDQIWQPDDPFRLCFATSEAQLNLSHRQADIGLRNSRPQSGNLASRKGAQVAFAPYCHRDLNLDDDNRWISIGREEGITPSSHWVHSQPELWIGLWVSTPTMLLEAALNKAGIAVLPCFVGDQEPNLKRAGDQIDDLEHTMWIVMHDDERHAPEKRTFIERISTLMAQSAALFSGAKPIL